MYCMKIEMMLTVVWLDKKKNFFASHFESCKGETTVHMWPILMSWSLYDLEDIIESLTKTDLTDLLELLFFNRQKTINGYTTIKISCLIIPWNMVTFSSRLQNCVKLIFKMVILFLRRLILHNTNEATKTKKLISQTGTARYVKLKMRQKFHFTCFIYSDKNNCLKFFLRTEKNRFE